MVETNTPPNLISAGPDAAWMYQTNAPNSQEPKYSIYTWTQEYNDIQTYPNGSYICLGIPTNAPPHSWEMIVNKSNLLVGRVMDTWPNPANWLIVDDRAEGIANESNKRRWRNRGIREGRTGTKSISRVLRNNGWTSEEKVRDKEGRLVRDKDGNTSLLHIEPTTPPNGIASWIQKGIGVDANWHGNLAQLEEDTLIDSGQKEAKFKAINRATWTRTCNHSKHATLDKTCRLCGTPNETKEHLLTECPKTAIPMRLFYNLSDIATKSTTIMTPTHRLLSLNFKGGNLKGSLATLHHLLIKKIVWKFTNQELADGHPKFEPYGVYKLAVESMAISFKQLQQKVYRAHKRAKATGTISSDGRYKKGYPLVTGYKNGRLTLHHRIQTADATHGYHRIRQKPNIQPAQVQNPEAHATEKENDDGRQTQDTPKLPRPQLQAPPG